jgi:hypothetical protein
MDMKLNFSSTYHPQMNDQMKRTNQILEDMLRAYTLKYGKSWNKRLPYAEFSYNNNYMTSIEMAPYEALYGRQCQTTLFWSQTGESQVFGPEVLKDPKSKWFARAYRLLSLGRRVMRTKREEPSCSKSVTLFTSRSHSCEALTDLR